MMGNSIVAIKGSFAAGHTVSRFTHGAGREFHGLPLAFGGLGTSLVAEKQMLEEEFFLISLWLRTSELNHYMDVMRSVQKDSSFFAGTAFKSFQALGPVVRRMDYNNDFLVGLTACVLVCSIMTYALNLLAVFVAGNVKIFAPVARLLGPSYQNDASIDSVIMFKTHAFRLYTAGMLCFFATAIVNMMRKPYFLAIPVCIIVAGVAFAFLYYAYDIRKRFDLPENQLTTGKVHFFQSKAGKANSVLPENSPKHEKQTAIQHFCIDCGTPYKVVSQQFCEGCGGESERFIASRKSSLPDVTEEDIQVDQKGNDKTGKKSRHAERGEETELASLV
jgi:hypothetical protein